MKIKANDSEMATLRQLMDEYVKEVMKKGYSIVFYIDDLNRKVALRLDYGDGSPGSPRHHDTVATYQFPGNEFNLTVGKFICLCKFLGKPIPDWIE